MGGTTSFPYRVFLLMPKSISLLFSPKSSLKHKTVLKSLILGFENLRILFFVFLRQGFKKKLKTIVEFSTKGKKCKILSITQFSENFEEKIIICHILKDMTIEKKLNKIHL